jgi:hypothetical protein
MDFKAGRFTCAPPLDGGGPVEAQRPPGRPLRPEPAPRLGPGDTHPPAGFYRPRPMPCGGDGDCTLPAVASTGQYL